MPVIRVEGFQVPQTQVPQSFETHQAYTDTTKFWNSSTTNPLHNLDIEN